MLLELFCKYEIKERDVYFEDIMGGMIFQVCGFNSLYMKIKDGTKAFNAIDLQDGHLTWFPDRTVVKVCNKRMLREE